MGRGGLFKMPTAHPGVKESANGTDQSWITVIVLGTQGGEQGW